MEPKYAGGFALEICTKLKGAPDGNVSPQDVVVFQRLFTQTNWLKGAPVPITVLLKFTILATNLAGHAIVSIGQLMPFVSGRGLSSGERFALWDWVRFLAVIFYSASLICVASL